MKDRVFGSQFAPLSVIALTSLISCRLFAEPQASFAVQLLGTTSFFKGGIPAPGARGYPPQFDQVITGTSSTGSSISSEIRVAWDTGVDPPTRAWVLTEKVTGAATADLLSFLVTNSNSQKNARVRLEEAIPEDHQLGG